VRFKDEEPSELVRSHLAVASHALYVAAIIFPWVKYISAFFEACRKDAMGGESGEGNRWCEPAAPE
jgi:hypothetical protein